MSLSTNAQTIILGISLNVAVGFGAKRTAKYDVMSSVPVAQQHTCLPVHLYVLCNIYLTFNTLHFNRHLLTKKRVKVPVSLITITFTEKCYTTVFMYFQAPYKYLI